MVIFSRFKLFFNRKCAKCTNAHSIFLYLPLKKYKKALAKVRKILYNKYKFEKTAFCHRHFSVLLLQIKSNFSFPIEIGREEEKANGCY